MIISKSRLFGACLSLAAAATMSTRTVSAQNVDFGGYPDEVKGGGDKVPPQCQLDIPRVTSSRFEVKWFCSDNFTSSSDIQSTVWIRRNGSQAFEQLGSFIGFPAASPIDESVLGVTNFADGLPIAIRLSASDKTGNQAISPAVIVSSGQELNGSCSLTIRTLPTESTGSTVGSPSLTVSASASNVLIAESSADQVNITTSGNTIANPCEIEEICFNHEQISFSANLNISGSTVSGSVEVIPGNLAISVSGQASTELSTVKLGGSTSISGKEATATLNCTR